MRIQALLDRLHQWRLVRRWRRRIQSRPDPSRRWWITFTPSPVTGDMVAWATDRPAPRDATIVSMLYWEGEAYFAIGSTVEEARDLLERGLGTAS